MVLIWVLVALLLLFAIVADRVLRPYSLTPRSSEGGIGMGIGVGMILIAAGAILAWAVDVSTSGVDLNVVGYILLVVGVLSMLVSLVFWSSWAGPGYFTRADRPRRRVIEEDV
jgi:Domain of unknown function (DUF6458)